MLMQEKIEGLTVNLRSALSDDAEFTYEIRKAEKAEYIHRLTGTVDDQRKWLEAQEHDETSYFFIVEDKECKPLGTISIYNITENDAEEGRSLMFGTPIQNTEGFMLAYDFAFDVLGLESTHSCVFVDNTRVIGIPPKFGASVEDERFNEEFGYNQRFFRIKRNDYYESRKKLQSLITRFANRG